MGGDAGGGSVQRVVVADAHPAIRGAVRLSCAAEPGLDVVEEASTGDELLASCRRLLPDAVVLDVSLPGADGFAVIREIRQEGLARAIVVLSERADGSTVLEALRLGVDGYLVKSTGLSDVGRSVARTLAGERVVSPELEPVTVQELGRRVRQAREGTEVRATLTPREHEILILLSEGSTIQQVAHRLGISPKTVETHVAKLYRKLDVRTRVQAVARAASLGLIELGRAPSGS
ncbi:MAG: response regulator transcription factor [Actinomycetota bacterium]